MNERTDKLSLSERIFLKLYCHPPPGLTWHEDDGALNVDGALAIFEQHLGDAFYAEIKDKCVLDIGCGSGRETLGAVLKGARHCYGMDIRPIFGKAQAQASTLGIAERVTFTTTPLETFEPGIIDVAISQNSFEHFADPAAILANVHRLLKPGGKFIITFSPPWYNPFGAHMFFMIKYPWAHILFSERTILNVRKLYRSDGAEHYSEVEGGLNQMTIRKFRNYIRASGLRVQRLEITPMRILPAFVRHIPGLNEFTTSTVSAILVKD